jgi:hypothetical protein
MIVLGVVSVIIVVGEVVEVVAVSRSLGMM